MNKVKYICLECGCEFQVDQGSRQRYCSECIIKKVTHKEVTK